ncbi:MAG: serine hydrolase domain-containing protein [Novosphingobium sp.]|uniref:serine hydrolase domain-containing protein n=1 Tax=Novosphingobium sp. TaxID=1874826 RepID=UPI0032BF15F3
MKLRGAVLLLLAAFCAAQAQAAPPARVAVAFDRASIRPVLVEGEADRAAHRPATADSLVRIASISKLVTALGVMRLVDAGKLDLDRDVSGYLGYPLRNPAFPDRPITLRLLLSHQSSLIDGDDLYLIPFGISLRERLADRLVWDTSHPPGSGWFHYTNLNFPVIASVIEKATGQRFDVAMQHLVLGPLKLDACFNWGAGCSAGAVRRAVVLYRSTGEVARDDLHGTFPACPVVAGPGGKCDLWSYRLGENGALFSPQGGLRISMRDLARIGQVLARRGKGFLSPRAYAVLTRPAWRLSGANGVGENGLPDGFFCAFGLALHTIGSGGAGCHDDLFGDGVRRIGHAGDAYGLKAGLWLDPRSGKGLAFFTTAVPDDAPKGRSAFLAAEESIVERAARVPFR